MTAPRRYRVTHRTAYGYPEAVTASYGLAHLTPRDAPGQRCRDSRVEVEPVPQLQAERTDYFGNRCTYLEVRSPHTRLVVTAVSEVEVTRTAVDLTGLDGWTCATAAALVTRVRPGAQTGPDGGGPGPGADPADSVDAAAAEFLLPSPQVPFSPELRRYAEQVLPPDRPLGQALAGLVHRLHTDIAYVPGATSVTTSPDEVLARREGVCQDLAHLAVGCLRLAGLPARYVSGYLETVPPPGRPRLQGADASHAWLSVLVPELGWVDLDPTNDRPVDADYVLTGWGRDYGDVPPLKGVIFSEGAGSTLTVGVDVVRLSEEAAADRSR